MPGSTPIYGFPYPDPSDLVANYPALGQQLAEDIEDVLPTIGGLAPVTPTTIANSGGTATLSGITVTASAVNSVSLNGVFTSTYRSYRIIFTGSSGADPEFRMRLRAAGTDNTASNYQWARMVARTGSVSGDSTTGTGDYAMIGFLDVSCNLSMDIANPQATAITTYNTIGGFSGATNNNVVTTSGRTSVTTSYDGFTLFPVSNTLTGTIVVYGYKN